jgi:hypothetical protein
MQSYQYISQMKQSQTNDGKLLYQYFIKHVTISVQLELDVAWLKL